MESQFDPIWHDVSNLNPDDARKGYHESTMSNKTPFLSHKVPRIMGAKAKKPPMCSISLIVIELKGLVAWSEAITNDEPLTR